MRSVYILVLSMLVLGLLSACSSPEEKAESHLENANALLAANQLQKARVEYANALQINQNLPEAWYGLARIYQRQGKWKETYKVLSQIRDTNPRHMNARVMLTKLLLASDQVDQALEDATDIVALSPEDARSHAIMASVKFRIGEREAARQSAERALALDPLNEEAIQMRASLLIEEDRFEQALALLNTAIEAKPENESFYILKLTVLSEVGDDAGVEQTYEKLIGIFPDKDQFKFALVRRYVLAGNIDQAERILMRSIEQESESIDEKLRLVIFKSNQRSLDDAIDLIKTYIEEDRDENRYRFILGELYLRNGQVDLAVALYRDIMVEEELAADGLEARNRIAMIYLETAKLAESRKLVDEVLAYDKNNEDGLLLQARFHLLDRSYNEAVTTLRTVLRDNPRSVEALDLIGQAQSAMGADNLAIESYTDALRQNPADPDIANRLATVLIRSNQVEQAQDVLLQSIEMGNETVDSVKLLTQVKMMLGDWKRAEQLAQRLQSFEGHESVSQHVLGLVYKNSAQNEKSIAAFKRAHELDPVVSEPLVALVQVYLESDQPEKARDFLNSVIEANPDNAAAYRLLAQINLSENDVSAAIQLLEKAVVASPEDASAYLQLASIYIGSNEPGKAEVIFQQGLENIPSSLELSMNLALIVERQGDFNRAIELYESLLRTNPDIMVAKNNLANLLLDHRSDEASIDRARNLAAELKSADLAVFRDTYAWASIRSGMFLEEAIAILKSIIRDNESVGLYYYHLGEAYRKTDNTFEARKHLRRAIELENPNSTIAVKARKSLELVSQ